MCSRTRVINAERFRRLLSHKRGFANLQSVIVTASILSWFFSNFEIRNMFCVKDPIPRGLRTCVVYKFFYVRAMIPAMSTKPLSFSELKMTEERSKHVKDVFYFLKFVKNLLLS